MPTPTIRIKLNPRFNNHTNVAAIAQRAAMIVSGSNPVLHISKNQTEWDIDPGHNWRMLWNEKLKHITISARYAGDDILLNVRAILIWAFNLEEFNPEPQLHQVA